MMVSLEGQVYRFNVTVPSNVGLVAARDGAASHGGVDLP